MIKESAHINIYTVDAVKIDFVNYSYAWIDEPIYENEIRLASIKDIAAMKINAIEGRGTKKDFIDIYFLLKRFSLKQMLEFYAWKYPENSIFRALMSLAYFEDAEWQLSPEMCIPTTWEEMKEFIRNEVKHYHQ